MTQENDDRTQLVALADKLGVEYDGRWGADRIAAAIHDASQPKAITPDIKPTRPLYHNTADQVREVIKPITDAKPDFQVIFDETTWTFRYKGAEDSGNLNIPLRLIKVKAEMVAKGRRSLMGFKDGKDTVLWA